MSRYNPIEQIWSAATANLPGILLQLHDQTDSEDGGYVSQSEAEAEADTGHEEEGDAGKEDEAESEGASNSLRTFRGSQLKKTPCMNIFIKHCNGQNGHFTRF